MKVLVTAASKHRSTAGIAASIADRLRSRGLEVDTAPPDEVRNPAEYDAIVLGSAVYGGRWMEPARSLAQRIGHRGRGRPVWLFSSGGVGAPPKPAGDPPEAAKMVAVTGARAHQSFAGRIDRSQLNAIERAMVKAVRAPAGDFRDWPAINAWADAIADELQSSPVT